ncbi:NAD(P)/FAD-dependent oxidoreductase [Gulosibacter molinativorax]|nr:FAD-dependent oxidoreductase [Gulosibacter molinativorax]
MSTKRIRMSFWLDHAPGRVPHPALDRDIETDLLVIGGGFTGLWTALHAKEREPDRRVVLLEGKRVGHAASGRNGGFVEPSLTHGLLNGLDRWPNEITELVRLGHENVRGMREAIARYGIDCDWRDGGGIAFARTDWEADALRDMAEILRQHEEGDVEFFGDERIHEVTASPAFVAALREPHTSVIDPVKLARGLADACDALGVEIYEGTVVAALDGGGRPDGGSSGGTRAGGARTGGAGTGGTGTTTDHSGGRLRAVTSQPGAVGAPNFVTASQVALATNAYPTLLRRLSLLTIPVYDMVLVTEPLTAEQFAAIGWTGDEGLSDAGNQFHYFRKTADGRILWGGYDAIYHYGSRRSEALTQREATFATLERNFRTTYPQLRDVRFTHQWGGMIDSSTRFSLTAGLARGGRVAYALGYTGLGVAATRFGADVMLDLLAGEATERTRLEMIRKKPVPFPPEPVRALGVNLTRWSMAAEDRTGKRNAWLHLMDALGLGFDS